jgi:hypothetical protein
MSNVAMTRSISKHFLWSVVLGILFAALLFTGFRYGPQFVLYLRFHRMLQNADYNGHLSSTPQPLSESGTSSEKGIVLSYFGCKFEVPWRDVSLERNEGRWAEVQFKTGQTVRVLKPKEFYTGNFITSYAVGNSSIWEMALEEGFPKSKYEQFRAVFSATPAQLSPLQSRPNLARTMVLIGQKGLYFERTPFKPEMFSFENPKFKGFEFSGISQSMEEVTLTIFDATDEMFTVRIRGDRRLHTNLSQVEINRVIDSFSIENEPPSYPLKRK